MKPNVLIIGHVWPEPNSSAAGSRMLQLLQLFITQNWKITFASSALQGDHAITLDDTLITQKKITLNDSSFNEFIQSIQPQYVIFDRFMTEEQFGWRVARHCPDTIRILNTEDLHCLRKSRQQSIKKNKPFEYTSLTREDITKREIASIYRCDLTFMISEAEVQLLQELFNIPKALLSYLPFLFEPITHTDINQLPAYQDRNHFITIGNFRHDPNWDSFVYLKDAIWPVIKSQLPNAELHIYGAYPPPKASQLQLPKKGIYVKGWVKNAESVMKNARICLAPLRFGAGIKGKLAEAMRCGTPSITTTIGAEGMKGNCNWNGSIHNDPVAFANAAVQLYQNKEQWLDAQQQGIHIINTRFQKTMFTQSCMDTMIYIQKNRTTHRSQNFIGAMLHYHTMRSTEFMSRWIEEKNK